MAQLLRIALLLFPLGVSAQMFVGQDTLYGNEWIDFGKTYYRIEVAEDAVYRVPYGTLTTSGFGTAVSGAELRLYHNGRQIPVYVSTDGAWGSGDFLEFYGEKNRIEVESQLFEDPKQGILNPWYSLFNDTSAYYLVRETTTPPLRIQAAANDLTNTPQPEVWCWQTTVTPFANEFLKRRIADKITYSWFNGEGWHRGNFSTNTTFLFNLNQPYTQGPDVQFRIRFTGDLGSHQHELRLHDSLYLSQASNNWRITDSTFTVPMSRFSPNVKLELKSLNGPYDYHYLAGYSVRYPRTFSFGGAGWAQIELDAVSDSYLEIKDFKTNTGAPVVYDLAKQTRIVSEVQGSTVRVRTGVGNAGRQIIIAAPQAGLKEILTPLRQVQFRQYTSESPANYIILTNSSLYKDPTMGNANHVAEYADYRRSANGGGYQVSIVDVNELYEQFGYGIRYSPLAIRNFTHFIKRNWKQADHLLIIGKGLDYEKFRKPSDQALYADSLFYVPMYGSPSIDMAFVMSRNKLSEPLMAVGRIVARTPRQIRDYLDKVIAHETAQRTGAQTLDDRAWMKRVIHISGGDAGEQQLIKGYATQMEEELENNRFGADVRTFYKTSNDPVQESAFEQIRGSIDEGISLWMIFGHSAPNAVDFDIGTASVYQNGPRYPYMFIMGCQTGICAVPQRSLGEEYVLWPNSGAITYSASASYATVGALATYGQQFYKQLGGPDYGNTLGMAIKHTTTQLAGTTWVDLISVLHQNVFQGDPAIRLQVAPGPDYVIDNPTVNIAPNPVPTDQATSELAFDIANIGENVPGKIAVRINQQTPDNTVRTLLTDTIVAPALRRSLKYSLPTGGSPVGYNRFQITVDAANQVAELPAEAEFNNDLIDAQGEKGIEVYVFSNDVRPVYPPDFGIVFSDKLNLQASTAAAAAPLRFLFELDTVEAFNSSFKKSYSVTQQGGLLNWQPGVVLKDSLVYYWRVARDSLVNGIVPWRSASFIYLKNGAPGWNQSHFGQVKTNLLSNLVASDVDRQVQFTTDYAYLTVKVGYRELDLYTGLVNSYYEGFNGDYGWNYCNVYRGVSLMLHDPATGHVIWNPPGGMYNPTPAERQHFFHFNTADSLQRIAMMEFIENQIPDNSTVGLYAQNSPYDTLGYDPENWAKDSITYGKNLLQVLEALGAKDIRKMAKKTGVPYPYGFIFRKGDPNFEPVDTFSIAPLEVQEMRRDIEARWFSGQWESGQIGPVSNWESLHFRPGSRDNSSDQTDLLLLGVRPNLPDTVLMTLKTTADTSLAAIKATQFPLLKLRYAVLDTTDNRSATQLGYARILYQPLPEGAIHPTAWFDFQQDTLEQGAPLSASLAFANVSDAAFDTLRVRFRIESTNGVKDYIRSFKPLPVGDTLHVRLNAPTADLSGQQRLLIDINPDNDQPELYHFNNVYSQPFFVSRDRRNPLLDVTFDGNHILDGDLVSPRPFVVVSLKDDNRYLAITDTSSFDLVLTTPDGNTVTLAKNDPAIQFFPANANALPQQNEAKIEWQPVFTQDGDYKLRVQGRDASGNESGSLDAEVNFKVITRSSLSNLLNYPNPFSNSTCFVYTMTGAETPTRFSMQIMTVSGKVVREVTAAEFGPLQAGTHQSSFCWDGKDEFGDQLANGVYLYRIAAFKADGTPFEMFDNSLIDGYFKGGFGKMVLMR